MDDLACSRQWGTFNIHQSFGETKDIVCKQVSFTM